MTSRSRSTTRRRLGERDRHRRAGCAGGGRADARAQGPKDGGAPPVVEDVENEMTARVRALPSRPLSRRAIRSTSSPRRRTPVSTLGRLTRATHRPQAPSCRPTPRTTSLGCGIWCQPRSTWSAATQVDIRLAHGADAVHLEPALPHLPHHLLARPDSWRLSTRRNTTRPCCRLGWRTLPKWHLHQWHCRQEQVDTTPHGDRIEMVFPQGRQPVQQASNGFSIFTYEEWSMIDRGATETQDAEMNDTQQPTGQEQEPLWQEINNDTLVNTQH